MVATEHLDSAPVCFRLLWSSRECASRVPVSLHGAPRERVVSCMLVSWSVEALKLEHTKSRNGRGFGFIAAHVGALNTTHAAP